jgi:hypothetical protein
MLDEKVSAALDNIFNDTVYFLIKSGNEENVSLAKAKVNKKRKTFFCFSSIELTFVTLLMLVIFLGCMVNTTC